MTSANAFHSIFETDTYVHARTLRTGFWQKTADTYFVYTGWVYNKKKKEHRNHVGLFDYATLMIPYLFDCLTGWCWTYSGDDPVARFFSVLLAMPALIISLVTNAVRFISAAIFTFCMFPIIGIVHGISRICGNPLANTVLSLPLENEKSFKKNKMKIYIDADKERVRQDRMKCSMDYDEERICQVRRARQQLTGRDEDSAQIDDRETLGHFFNENGGDLDDVRAYAVGSYNAIKLEISRIRNLGRGTCLDCRTESRADHDHVEMTVILDMKEAKDREYLDAVLRLNIGGVTRKLEKAGVKFRFFQPVAVNSSGTYEGSQSSEFNISSGRSRYRPLDRS